MDYFIFWSIVTPLAVAVPCVLLWLILRALRSLLVVLMSR